MSKIFLISDHHFGHENILTFLRKDGSRLRDFPTMKIMNEYMIHCWNEVVKPEDKVYHLGDVTFSNRFLPIMENLHGTKVLIKGNHDNLKISQYAQYFKDIRAYHVLDRIVLAHVPIHPDSLARWKGQVHGHTHANNLEDERYFNVSVENVNYTPVAFEQIREYFDSERGRESS